MSSLSGKQPTTFINQKVSGGNANREGLTETARKMSHPHIFFIITSIATLMVYFAQLSELFTLSLQNELYSHIVLIPFVSAYFIYSDRKEIFSETHYSIYPGIVVIIAGAILYILGRTQGIKFSPNDYLSIMIFSALIICLGWFILFYGIQTFKNAAFPLLFLVFVIPIPDFVVNKIIFALQVASAEVSYVFIKLTGVPIYREGFLFQLPGVAVEVAKECSGIRSSMALFLTSILAGQIFLRSWSRKIMLMIVVFPIAVIKNGIRIMTLSLLGTYVDITFLTNSLLHKRGGVVFFILALFLMGPILWVLKKSEGENSKVS